MLCQCGAMPNLCQICKANLDLVGRVHRCVPTKNSSPAITRAGAEAAPKFKRPRIEDRDKTITARKPWAAQGMSRRTWYRRQEEAKRAK